MSHYITDQQLEKVVEDIAELQEENILVIRKELEDDLLDYISDNYSSYPELDIKEFIIMYLSKNSHYITTSKDINNMASYYDNSGFNIANKILESYIK